MYRKVAAVWVSLLIIVSSIVILVEIAEEVEAPTTLYVGGGGPGNYSKIQMAIDNASDGDTVFVYNGTYYENVVVNKTINLTGEDRENTIIDGGLSGDVVQIEANWTNVTGFSIINGKAQEGFSGIKLSFSNITITNNALSFNHNGIFLFGSFNNKIINNTITSNTGFGTRLWISSYNEIINNNLSSNSHGLSIEMSSNNDVIGNYISNVGSGITILESLFNTVTNNDFVNDGVIITGGQLLNYNSHNISSDNLVNGKPLYYFKNNSSSNIDGLLIGQLILANCTDIKVKNLEISKTDVGITNAYSSNITISDCTITSNDDDGIYIAYSFNNILTRNTILNNDGAGIYLWFSSNTTIVHNNVSYNDKAWGMRFLYSTFNALTYNNVTANNYGIYLSDSSNNNSIKNNFLLSHITDGITTEYSYYNHIERNNISSSGYKGINIGYSSNNKVIANDIWNNDKGIWITHSSFNLLHHNNIMNNSEQAIDNRDDNYWDDGYPSGGNYWSDHSGVDDYKGPNQDISGKDGIFDTNYSVDVDSLDHYPLIEPFDDFITLKSDWNLISIPLFQDNPGLLKVLEMIDGYYDAVQWYDPTDQDDPWKHHKVGKPFGNDLFELNETMSFWIHITPPGSTIFLYNGTTPTSNQTIQLHPGWNMVGYPSLSNHNRTTGLNNLIFDTHIDAIQWYDASSKTWHFMGPDDSFVPGRGYWVHSLVETDWEVPL